MVLISSGQHISGVISSFIQIHTLFFFLQCKYIPPLRNITQKKLGTRCDINHFSTADYSIVEETAKKKTFKSKNIWSYLFLFYADLKRDVKLYRMVRPIPSSLYKCTCEEIRNTIGGKNFVAYTKSGIPQGKNDTYIFNSQLQY